MEKTRHEVSPLGKTWIFDLDGTIVKHNGYITDGADCLLDGALHFLQAIPSSDMILFLTSRKESEKEQTERFLKEAGIRYDDIIYNAPYGERILVNDKKPSGLITALAINTERDKFMEDDFIINEDL